MSQSGALILTLAEYRRAKAALKARWAEIAQLRGDAYIQALGEYIAEKERLASAWKRIAANTTRAASRDEVSGARPALAAARPIPGLARLVTAAYWSRRLDIRADARRPVPAVGWEGMPEVAAARLVRDAGGDPPAVRRVLTFTAAMDRARDADALWIAAARLYQTHPWIFDPSGVATRRDEAIALLRSSRVSQRHGDDAKAWLAIAGSMQTPGPVGEVVLLGKGDAVELLEHIRRDRTSYPLLRGECPRICVGSAGINRSGERNERVQHRRVSGPRWPRAVRCSSARAAAKRR
jgi:hypothetical protein